MNSPDFKKGLSVQWFNRGFTKPFTGKLKTLIKNPNGNDVCIIQLDDSITQTVSIDITSLRLVN